jgi:hypothetical protein
LAWNDLGEPIASPRDELIARVVGRGERLRRRRRAGWAAGTLVAVLAVVVPATAWSGGDGSRPRVVSASEGQAPLEAVGEADPTTTVPPPDGAPTTSSAPSTTVRPSTSTTARPAATTPESTSPRTAPEPVDR